MNIDQHNRKVGERETSNSLETGIFWIKRKANIYQEPRKGHFERFKAKLLIHQGGERYEHVFLRFFSKILLILLMLALTFSCGKNKKTKALDATDLVYDYDFSGIDLFFKIADSLLNDIAVDDRTWDALFETEGYRALKNNDGIRNNIILTFKPSYGQKLDSLIPVANYWWKRDLNHLIDVKKNLTKLKVYREQLDIQKVLKNGSAMAKAYIPQELDTIMTLPPIRFVVFSPDARVMGGKIMFDLHFLMQLDDEAEISKLAGHEFHHYYLGFMEGREKGLDSEHPLYPLYRPIRQLQIEGVADLINKKDYIQTAPPDELWYQAYYQSNGKIKFMNDRLEELAKNEGSLAVYGQAIFNNFPINCHPNGFYMGELIEKELRKPAVVATLKSHSIF